MPSPSGVCVVTSVTRFSESCVAIRQLRIDLQRCHVRGGDTAVDEERGAGNERRVVTCEERNGGRQFFGVSKSTNRNVNQTALSTLLILREKLLKEWSVDGPRAECIYADALASELHTELAAHGEHATL